MNILVSINCITYNHEDYISDAIESFLMQKTNFEFEILIGEDCSTDHTREIVEKYSRVYPEKIKIITSDKNVGWRKNSERLLEKSKGKYIAICEGDDYWLDSNKLQKQVEFMERHPECSFCFHSVRVIQENGNPTGEILGPYNKNCISSIKDIITGGGGFCSTPSILFLKSYMKDPPDFFLNAHVGDYPLQMWLADQGCVYYFNECMAAYRTGHKGSWTSRLNSGPDLKEKFIKAKESDIKILDDFNKYTNYKYSEEIEETITKRKFEILLLQNRIIEANRNQYKTYFNKLSFKEKIRILTKFYFPKLYSILEFLKKRNQNITKYKKEGT